MNDEVVSKLLNHREKLLGYVRKRLSSPELAEDVLQESLIKALRAAPDLRDEEKLLPWFYRILNNAIIDVYRRKHIETEHLEPYSEEKDLAIAPEDKENLCNCFRELIPTLKPEYGELIEALDLNERDPKKVAEGLGITLNNLKVRRHRARQALRERLEETCRSCAKHGCLDCTCRKGQIQPGAKT